MDVKFGALSINPNIVSKFVPIPPTNDVRIAEDNDERIAENEEVRIAE